MGVCVSKSDLFFLHLLSVFVNLTFFSFFLQYSESRKEDLYEPLLAENEKEAVSSLLRHLEGFHLLLLCKRALEEFELWRTFEESEL